MRLAATLTAAATLLLAGCMLPGTTLVIPAGQQADIGRTPPGLYSAEAPDPGRSCYWARHSGLSGNTSDIIANDNATGHVIVEIKPGDVSFEAGDRCKVFVPIGPAPIQGPPDANHNGDGYYRVGTDIAPGRWQANGPLVPGRSCYWERTTGFGGTSAEILANGISSGIQIVDIAPTDVGFVTSGCAGWAKIA